MNKNRYLLCLLLSCFLLYYAVPRLSMTAGGPQGVFSIAWLAFALFAIAGNLTALLYSPKRQGQKHQPARAKKKMRSFH